MKRAAGYESGFVAPVTRERIGMAQNGVVMRTQIERTEIVYTVELGGGISTDRDETVWRRVVVFGATDATCAGGSAFVTAAREQERVGHEWAKQANEANDDDAAFCKATR